MTHRGGLITLLVALAGLPALAGTALAQVSDADKSTARALAQQGQDALDRRDFTAAVERFERARQLYPAPTLTLGLARAQVGLGRWVSAHETYLRTVREGAPAGTPPAFHKAVEDAKRELEALAPRIPSLTIQLRGASAAAVTVDGAPVPPAAIGISRPVDPGRHVIAATAEGFAPAEIKILSVEAKSESVTLELRALPGGAPRLAVVPAQAPAGDTASGRKIGGIVALGVGGALVVAGAVMLTLQFTTKCDPLTDVNFCDPPPPTPPYGIIAAVTLAAGGGSIVTGAVLLATLPKTQPGPVAIVPVITPGFVGVRGRF